MEEAHGLFATMPSPPKSWPNHGQPVTFRLVGDEESFLRNQLLATRRFGTREPSLLARLAEDPERVRAANAPWRRAVMVPPIQKISWPWNARTAQHRSLLLGALSIQR